MKGAKRRHAYSKEYPKKMYMFFKGYSEGGVPSFRKFAESIGLTLDELLLFRGHGDFERAYRECSEIRRDYLIDNALARRFDPSFAKYLLTLEYGEADPDGERIDLRLEVVGE